MKKNLKKSVALLFGVSAVHLQAWSFLYRKLLCRPERREAAHQTRPVRVRHKHLGVPSFTKPREEEEKPKGEGWACPRLDQRAGEAFNASKAD